MGLVAQRGGRVVQQAIFGSSTTGARAATAASASGGLLAPQGFAVMCGMAAAQMAAATPMRTSARKREAEPVAGPAVVLAFWVAFCCCSSSSGVCSFSMGPVEPASSPGGEALALMPSSATPTPCASLATSSLTTLKAAPDSVVPSSLAPSAAASSFCCADREVSQIRRLGWDASA